ncbi:MAG: hypothetical protein LBD49_01660 [Oscillospiraceae bacterium]|jgi:4-hydroxy 2-oxovalerate aldolase|nr:hypothetical protein [Oscillospiraceae bacterium]
MGVQLLDCTLRDGAHVNSGRFGERCISNIISGLTEASADIVEIGFLKNVEYSADATYFPRVEDACRVLAGIPPNPAVKYALMARADEYDIGKLTECDGTVGLIRIAFYYDFLDGAIGFAKEVKARGYDFTLNLINTPGCSPGELRKVAGHANAMKPYALNIVDTFGVLYEESLENIVKAYDSALDPNIRMGLHLHENISSAFPLIQWYIKHMGGKRDIVADGSLMGIGRAPGNLCTELAAGYLNARCGKSINLPKILRLISRDILPLKKIYKWGYSPEYFLSAAYKVHRSYAEHLSEAGLGLDDVDLLLSKIKSEYSAKFNKAHIDELAEAWLDKGAR